MELFNFFMVIMTSGVGMIAFSAVASALILWCVIEDECGYKIGKTVKWVLLSVFVGLLYISIHTQGLDWMAFAWQFAIGAVIVCSIKSVETISMARQSLKSINTDIKNSTRANIVNAQRNLMERFEEQANIKSLKSFLVGDTPNAIYDSVAMKIVNIIVQEYSAETTQYVNCGANGEVYRTRTISNVVARHIADNIEKYILENADGTVAIDFRPLLDTEFFQEIARQQSAARFNKNNTLFTIKLGPTDKVIPNFTILESGRTHINMTQTEVTAELRVSHFVERLGAWMVFWPFFAIMLLFGRFLEMIANVVKRIFGLLFNKIVFKNII